MTAPATAAPFLFTYGLEVTSSAGEPTTRLRLARDGRTVLSGRYVVADPAALIPALQRLLAAPSARTMPEAWFVAAFTAVLDAAGAHRITSPADTLLDVGHQVAAGLAAGFASVNEALAAVEPSRRAALANFEAASRRFSERATAGRAR